MRCSLLKIWALGLLGLSLLGNPTAFGQEDNQLFNNEEGIFGDPGATDDSTDGQDTPDTPQTTPGVRLPFGFGNQLSEEDAARVEELFNNAKGLVEQGDLNGALAQLDAALAINRSHFPSYLERGRIEAELGFTEQAIQTLGLAIAVGTNRYEGYLERGKAYMKVQRYRPAVADFQSALARRRGDAEVLFQLGLAQAEFGYGQILGTARQESIEAAINSFDLALQIKEDYPEALFERGSALLQSGQLDDAIDDLKKAVELDANNPKSVAQLGFATIQRAGTESSRRNGQKELIVEDFQTAIAALTGYFAMLPPEGEEEPEPEDEASQIRPESAYVARAVAHIGLGDELSDEVYYQRAIQDAEAALELNPDFPNAYYQKGLAQRMLGDLDAAAASFTDALVRSPGEPEALLRRGIVFFRQGDYSLALTDFLDATRFSANPRARFWAGLSNSKLGNYAQAVVEYNTALRYQSEFPLAYLNRGLAHLKLERFDRAIADFNEVLRRDRGNATAKSMRELAMQLSQSQ